MGFITMKIFNHHLREYLLVHFLQASNKKSIILSKLYSEMSRGHIQSHMVPKDLNIGFQGLALIQGQIYNHVFRWHFITTAWICFQPAICECSFRG